MKKYFVFILLLVGYTSSFADNYFQDTLWMKKTDQSNGFYMLKFSKNDSIIAGFGYEKTIFYEAKTGNEIARIDGHGYGQFINNDNQFIRVAGGNTGIEILDVKSWQRIDFIENEGLAVGSFDITNDERYLVAVITNGIRKWDLSSKKILSTKIFNPEPKTLTDFRVTNLRITSDKSKILYNVFKSYFDSNPPYKTFEKIYVTISNFNILDSIDNYTNLRAFSISKGSKYIALKTGDNKNGVEIYDFASKQLLHKLPVNGLNVTGMEFSSDEKYLVTSDQYENMNTWNIETGKSEFVYVNGCTSNFNLSHNQKYIIWSCSRLLSLYNTHWSTTSINDPTNIITTLYPNPSNGLLNINLIRPILGSANIQITNSNGNILMNIPNIIPQNNIVSFRITQLPIGTYFLTLSADNFYETYKVIKE